MGTRGTVKLIYKNKTVGWYVQNDADMCGSEMLAEFRLLVKSLGLQNIKYMVERLKVVGDDIPPTLEEQKLLSVFADTSVGNGSLNEWYCLLRKCQHSLKDTLVSGYVLNTENFEEYNWVFDFDNSLFYCNEGKKYTLN